ncbi:hypothetical protein AMAG_10054 [Allomyces macrogynus ATCC 38327]|uniref:Homeobox domain-containing protein n=1 Tax=Allomyces macrogynus (strain ATCC 38327) TaxID=578462 RepID=A0A0L0SQ78_ALLM3|nr:hypothetical protein AMAG_10054 [Allomyces macrogynus ATCC 38327]|eukprot:KNE64703.1 hypothetical protein AMAG_10054 [Allomyces macrogynus ATCC 38327]
MPLSPSSSFDLALPSLFPSSCSSLPHPAGPEGSFGSMVPASAPVTAAATAASSAMTDCWTVSGQAAAAAALHGPAAVPVPRPFNFATTTTTTTTTTPSTLLAAPTTSADVAAASWMTSFLPTPLAETAPTGRSAATAADALDAAARLPFMAPPSNAPLVLHHPFMPFADQYAKPEPATAAAAPANRVAPVVIKNEHVLAAPPSPLPSPRPSPASSNATHHLAATSDDDTTSTGPAPPAAATSEKPRSRLTREQTAILKRVYAVTYFPDRATKEQLAGELGIPVRTVQIWFQNQRQYHRIKLKKKAAKAKASGASGDLESAAITKVALPRVKSTASASSKSATPALVELRPAATAAPPTPVPTPTLPALAPLLARRASAPVAASRIPLPVPPAAPLGLPTVLPMTPTSPHDHAWHAPAPLVAPAPPPAAPAPEFQLDYVAFEALLNTYPASANAVAHGNAHWLPMTTQAQSQQQYSSAAVPRQRAYSWMQ